MKKLLTKKIEIESNTEYCANENVIDVFNGDSLHKGYRKDYAYGAGENSDVAFMLEDKENIVLDFNGATLLMHGKIQPFIINNCKNITIKNLFLKYVRSPFSEGEVVEIGDTWFKVKFSKEFPYRIKNGNLEFYCDDWENTTLHLVDLMFMQFFDAKTRQGKGLTLVSIGATYVVSNRPYTPYHLKPFADGEFVRFEGYTGNFFFGVGDRFVIGHENRALSSFYVRDTENIKLENVQVLNGQGMGFLPFHCKDICLDNLRFTYCDKSTGFVTNSADAIHAVANSGDFVIKNCIIDGMIDDALNIHSNYWSVESYEKNKLNIVCKGPDGVEFPIFEKGDELCIHKSNTMDERGRYIVKSVIFDGLDKYKQNENFDKTRAVIILDRDIEYCEKDDNLENTSCQSNLTIINTKMGKGNTHIRLQTRGKTIIKDSEFELPIWFTGDASYWFESSPMNDVLIENCKFITNSAIIRSCPEVMPSKDEPYYHKNIVVKNCIFDSKCPLELDACDNFTFIGNKNTNGGFDKAILKNCGKANIQSDIKVERITEEKKSVSLN